MTMMKDLHFIANNEKIVSKWVDSPISEFVIYFKRSLQYQGEYGFSWFEQGDYLFDYSFKNSNSRTSYSDKKSYSNNLIKYEYDNREDIVEGKDYRLPILILPPKMKNIKIDLFIQFTSLPQDAGRKQIKIYNNILKDKKFILKTSVTSITFVSSEITLSQYCDPNFYFESFLLNNDVNIYSYNINKGTIYIPNIEISINGDISEDGEIWIEDDSGKKIGSMKVISNVTPVKLPIQFVIPYRKDKKDIEVNSVLTNLKNVFSDIDQLLDKINNYVFCQSLLEFYHSNPTENIVYLELRPSTDTVSTESDIDLTQMSDAEKEDYNEKVAFSKAITGDKACSFKNISKYLELEYNKLGRKDNPFIVNLMPYNYADYYTAGGASPVYARVSANIILNSVDKYKIIAHELGHALGLHHCNEDKEIDYNKQMDLANTWIKDNDNFINSQDQLAEESYRKGNESEIDYRRRYIAENKNRTNLTPREKNNLKNCKNTVNNYEKSKKENIEYNERIKMLDFAKKTDKYLINDNENLMQQSFTEDNIAVLQPWQTKVIVELNSEKNNVK